VDKATIAIFVSVASAIVAAISFGWNVYRDVLLKARVKVTFGVRRVVQEGAPPSPEYIDIHATNHGPGVVRLTTIVLLESSILKKLMRKEQYAFLIHDYKNRYTGHLPSQLEVGEGVDLFVDYDRDCFLNQSLTSLGNNDSFGRTHWAPRRYMKQMRKKWLADFGENLEATD